MSKVEQAADLPAAYEAAAPIESSCSRSLDAGREYTVAVLQGHARRRFESKRPDVL